MYWNLNLLQRLHNRLLKIASKNTFQMNNYPHNLKQLFAYEVILNRYDNLELTYNHRKTNTRNKSIPKPKITKTVSNQNSYLVAIRIFNELPNDIKKLLADKQIIKLKLKT